MSLGLPPGKVVIAFFDDDSHIKQKFDTIDELREWVRTERFPYDGVAFIQYREGLISPTQVAGYEFAYGGEDEVVRVHTDGHTLVIRSHTLGGLEAALEQLAPASNGRRAA